MRYFYKIAFLFLALFFICSCRQVTRKEFVYPQKDEIAKTDIKYSLYREQFFKYFLDEGKNRFNGCVPEKIYISQSKWSEKDYLEDYLKIKFADSTIYNAMALAFLANDLIVQQKAMSNDEFNRSVKLLGQVLQGLRNKDELSKNGLDGFYLRDTVSSVKGIKIESDYLRTANGANEMSGSQSSAIVYGLHFALVSLEGLDKVENPEINKYKLEIRDQLHRLLSYLKSKNFVIRSEIKLGKKVRRGPYVYTLRWPYQAIDAYWQNNPKLNKSNEVVWTLFYKGVNWFCRFNVLSVRKYNEFQEYSPKNYGGKSYAAFYSQMLETALLNIREENKDLRRWHKDVWRYQNTLAVCLALKDGKNINNSLKSMAWADLQNAPMHLPDNFSKDHKGWNHDNRWVRLMKRSYVPDTREEIQIFNGLDFLWAYSAFRVWLANASN